jgi:hypothetical protein
MKANTPAQARRALRPPPSLSPGETKALLWPIVKRVPAYVRLGWALCREPAIPHRHKTLLYTTLVYTFTPAHLLLSPVPVLGQVDSLVLLLLGIRQAVAHCPAEVCDHHLARLKLAPTQLNRDLHVTLYVSWHTVGKIGRPLGHHLRFAGRVLRGFSRRTLKRLLEETEEPQ